MSKNFELMQQAASAREFQSTATVGEAATLPPVNANGFAKSNGQGLDLDRFAREESLKLVQRVFLLQASTAPRVVMFAGVEPGNGCSRICAQTAEVLAANILGTVCVIDANLRTPSLPEYFGVTNHRGLTDSLLQDGPVRGFAKQLRPANLWLLSCGSMAADSTRLLNSDQLQKRLLELRKEFDYVLIDAPPLARYGDAIALGKLTDGFVLILEANSTRREVALTVSENLRAAGIKILGAVLNKRTFPLPERLYHLL